MKYCFVTDIWAQPSRDSCRDWLGVRAADASYFTLTEIAARPSLEGEQLHDHLFSGDGAAHVVNTLMASVPDGAVGIGFSAGGTLLWQAALQGLNVSALYCISSTRLRVTGAIATPNHVYFGQDDPHLPRSSWLDTVPQAATVFPNREHGFYTQSDGPQMQIVRDQIRHDTRAGFRHPLR